MFERFTPRARNVMVLAQHEATALHHNFIGTEHLLLGLLGEPEGIGAETLTSLGLDPGAIRATVLKLAHAGGAAPVPGKVPFTGRAKKVLELSLREALHLGHNYIGTEHILLGLLREGEGVAAEALVALGVSLVDVRARVLALISGAVDPGPATPGMSPAAVDAITRAVVIADGETVTTGQLMRAVLEDTDAQATRALVSIGVDLHALDQAIAATPADNTSDDPRPATIEIKIGDTSTVITDADLLAIVAKATSEQITEALRRLGDDSD
jgi:ATP-dependent Clp protease ATP-binding subunit ClpA